MKETLKSLKATWSIMTYSEKVVVIMAAAVILLIGAAIG